MKDGLELEAAVALLESSADYRVLRRLVPREPTGTQPSDENIKAGVFLDVETTGLDPERDKIIELGMVRFSFSPEGEVLATDSPFSRLRQPSKPIPAEITRLTGITDEMVAGKAIGAAEVDSLVETAVTGYWLLATGTSELPSGHPSVSCTRLFLWSRFLTCLRTCAFR